MSKEVLFRGKRIYDGKWVEGGILCTENWASIFVCKDYQGSLNEAPYSDVEEIDVIPETVGQFTGLLDKNGKEIFEGDIVKTHYANCWTKYKYSIEQVVFHNGRFCAFKEIMGCKQWTNIYDGVPHLPQDKSYYMDSIEVVGNIHDNPELLEMKGDA